MSIGAILSIPPIGITEADALKRSDQALYQAKACARNQIHWHK